MFGYIIANEGALADADRTRYREVYCGVCRSLGRECGQLCRMTLSYDMTFLAILLNSLYEPREERGEMRCTAHPIAPAPYSTSEFTDYAADATVVLAYHKCLDDWHDERKASRRAFAKLIEGAYRRITERRGNVVSAVEAGMADIHAIEDAREPSLDAAANRFGQLMGCVFACRDDIWADNLRALGAALGKFVYIMDAVMDYGQDKESGSYNPLVAANVSPDDASEALTMLAAHAAAAFERLPLVQDEDILRNVLYSGIWGQYAARQAKNDEEETHHGNGPL